MIHWICLCPRFHPRVSVIDTSISAGNGEGAAVNFSVSLGQIHTSSRLILGFHVIELHNR